MKNSFGFPVQLYATTELHGPLRLRAVQVNIGQPWPVATRGRVAANDLKQKSKQNHFVSLNVLDKTPKLRLKPNKTHWFICVGWVCLTMLHACF